MINVTKTFLPPFEEYIAILKRAWDKGWITNNGELLLELEDELRKYLGVKNLLYCGNGTVVLQMALKVFNITKEVITTPFSYVATTNAILWERCTPVFVDIEKNDFCIDAYKIEDAITENTQAILAAHVYGLPCNIDKIEKIAFKYNLKIIYDGAHAFGCTYKGNSLLSYGDISTCSFHATKLFHTVEGGCIISNDEEIINRLRLFRQFGHEVDDYQSIGLNGKNSEFHAAMGLTVLPKVADIISTRKKITEYYFSILKNVVRLSKYQIEDFNYNYSYLPVLFDNEDALLKTMQNLKQKGINTRRYFYPSLNTLPYLSYKNTCPISEDISVRILCLPLFYDLKSKEIDLIANIISSSVQSNSTVISSVC